MADGLWARPVCDLVQSGIINGFCLITVCSSTQHVPWQQHPHLNHSLSFVSISRPLAQRTLLVGSLPKPQRRWAMLQQQQHQQHKCCHPLLH